ncbi:ketose-bisphosphate aldolase [Brachybacterium sacelli]|uniref:Fructose-bisphosphate aldolase class II n=1 Tax=Brachybacterium sacelli TaxID=173364 RepID=A0ABS4WZ27_9MICO|nr:ketose-bisphosphate aldolase [Brachybacterium sacelli]MBP2381452.1 fructose-bisphosphate aldolase class II [Brachybacterium sacelli]
MLINGIDLLTTANENSFAVPAFNISDWAMMRGIIEISEELDSPLIVAIHPDELAHAGEDVMPSIIQASRKASVPVAIHFDHGTTYEQMLQAVRTGFTSVMLDGSMHEYEQNVELTQQAVGVAHPLRLSVEAELGTIGKTDDEAEAGTDDIIYTDPEVARDFVERTGVDSLAVAIGTRHGIYPSHLKPELKLDLLKELKAAVSIPLVLHGGSNNPDDEIAEAVTLGVNKINISSDIKVAYHQKMREVLQDGGMREPNVIQPDCVGAMKETAAHKIRLFAADGKAALYPRLTDLR